MRSGVTDRHYEESFFNAKARRRREAKRKINHEYNAMKSEFVNEEKGMAAKEHKDQPRIARITRMKGSEILQKQTKMGTLNRS